MSVGFSAFSGLGVVVCDPIYLIKLGFRLALEVEDGLVAQQLQVKYGDVEQNVVRRRLGTETCSSTRCRAARGSNQASVSGVKMVTAGISTVPATSGLAPPPR